MKSTSLCLLFIAAIAGGTLLAETPAYDAFLLPVVVSDAPGAFGARWDTTVFYIYHGASAFAYLDNVLLLGNRYFTPGERGVLALMNVPHTAASPGFILDTTLADAGDFDIVCYVHERSAKVPGVTIPAVRLSQIGAGATVRLLAVPVASNARTVVRIYDLLRDVTSADVKARVYGPDGVLLQTDVVHLDTPSDSMGTPYATYGEYRPPGGISGPISIEIEPPGIGFRLWAFSTTTDNVTQAVTPVFPSH